MRHEITEFFMSYSADTYGRWGWRCTCGDEVGGYMMLANAEYGHDMHRHAHRTDDHDPAVTTWDEIRKQVRG